ncbi:hypothetical protein SAMN05660895_1646 [Thermoflavifilum thermophilum]|uniref:Uncharacterized protein n=1 Tax=Thermoflavifilum thermophilum TaxID=1393122 RepID=A0A1I7NF92_9BACT|nr:hypothetical protein SAMN05660895_1646 [Thermoflavifilum thermophilum]
MDIEEITVTNIVLAVEALKTLNSSFVILSEICVIFLKFFSFLTIPNTLTPGGKHNKA